MNQRVQAAEALAKNAQARADSLATALKEQKSAQAAAERERLAEARRADSIREATERQRRAQQEDSIHEAQRRPQEATLFASTGVTIAAKDYQRSGVVINDSSECKLHGRVEATDGGNRDIEVLIFAGDEFTNWKNSPQAKATTLFHTGPQTVTSLDVALPGIGTYYLVLSNRFSVLTAKTVKGQVAVTCLGQAPQVVP